MHEPRELLPNPLTQPEQERAMRRLRERTLAGALRVTLSSRHERTFLAILGVLYGFVPALALFVCLYFGGPYGLIVFFPALGLYLLALAFGLLAVIFVETSARRARAVLTRSAYGALRAKLSSDAPPGALELTSEVQERAGALTSSHDAGALTVTPQAQE